MTTTPRKPKKRKGARRIDIRLDLREKHEELWEKYKEKYGGKNCTTVPGMLEELEKLRTENNALKNDMRTEDQIRFDIITEDFVNVFIKTHPMDANARQRDGKLFEDDVYRSGSLRNILANLAEIPLDSRVRLLVAKDVLLLLRDFFAERTSNFHYGLKTFEDLAAFTRKRIERIENYNKRLSQLPDYIKDEYYLKEENLFHPLVSLDEMEKELEAIEQKLEKTKTEPAIKDIQKKELDGGELNG